MKTSDKDLVVVATSSQAIGFKIPAPAWDPEYHQKAAGFVGDYRPLSERVAERARIGGNL